MGKKVWLSETEGNPYRTIVFMRQYVLALYRTFSQAQQKIKHGIFLLAKKQNETWYPLSMIGELL